MGGGASPLVELDRATADRVIAELNAMAFDMQGYPGAR